MTKASYAEDGTIEVGARPLAFRRRAKGVPRVDQHVYSLQNGQIIEALATAAEYAGDADLRFPRPDAIGNGP